MAGRAITATIASIATRYKLMRFTGTISSLSRQPSAGRLLTVDNNEITRLVVWVSSKRTISNDRKYDVEMTERMLFRNRLKGVLAVSKGARTPNNTAIERK